MRRGPSLTGKRRLRGYHAAMQLGRSKRSRKRPDAEARASRSWADLERAAAEQEEQDEAQEEVRSWVREIVVGLVAGAVVSVGTLVLQARIDDQRQAAAERVENLRFVRDRSVDLTLDPDGRPIRNAFQGIDLAGQNLSGLDLSGDNFLEAILTETDLSSTRFEGSNLARADLSDADLSDAVLAQAVLTGANLAGANLTGVVLTDVVLDGICHDGRTRWPENFEPPESTGIC